MQHATTTQDPSNVLANWASQEMERTVKTSMNALTIHAMRMLHARTWWGHINAPANRDSMVRARTVKISTNANYRQHAMLMQPVQIWTDHTPAPANLASLGTKRIVKISMNVTTAHAMPTPHAPTTEETIPVLAIWATLEMELCAEI